MKNSTQTVGLTAWSNGLLSTMSGVYNVNVGTSYSGTQGTSSKSLGVTTDGAKSGIVCTVSAQSISSKKIGGMFIKF